MDVADALLDSWDRQCRIVQAVAGLIDEGNRHFKPSADSLGIDGHLAHIHGTRRYFLSEVASDLAEPLPHAYADSERTRVADLDAVRACLVASGQAVREATRRAIESGGPMTGAHVVYDNPVLFMQHLVWHEGWHMGQILQALRVNGQEPPEEWEEPNVWGRWRTETW